MNKLNSRHSPIFRFNNIAKKFRNGDTIHYIGDVTIRRGIFTFITGTSGVGKSTLVHILGLLDKPDRVDPESRLEYYPNHGDGDGSPVNFFDLFKSRWKLFNGANQRAAIRRKDFGFLPQHGHLLNTFSIMENLQIVSGLRHFPCQNPQERSQNLTEILEKVGFKKGETVWQRRHFSPLNLSGGQQQRLALARAVLCTCHPKVIFVDEPTTYMDEELIQLTFDLLVNFVIHKGCTIILVTHEYNKLFTYLTNRKTVPDSDQINLIQESRTDRLSRVRIDKRIVDPGGQ